jgi:stearoyl-CoA desaturase (Delta-9 desaturase)
VSWQGALTAFFWATLVRIAFLHHITWSINSICHTFGKKEFEVRDKSRNVSWLAILSFGESWHNLHHADPTCARHGVLKGQIDIAARTIWLAEKLGWVYAVRRPDAARLTGKQTGGARWSWVRPAPWGWTIERAEGFPGARPKGSSERPGDAAR